MRLALVFILTAAPALATTVPPEIIWTDLGFRPLEDCREAWPEHVWYNGSYWSVRPTWNCEDNVYVGGKFDWNGTSTDDGEDYALAGVLPALTTTTATPSAGTPSTPRFSGTSLIPPTQITTSNNNVSPPNGGETIISNSPPDGPALIPLPASGYLMLGGLFLLFRQKRSKRTIATQKV
jgi:hypothetical protein